MTNNKKSNLGSPAPNGDTLDAQILSRALEAAIPDHAWLNLLQVLAPLGLADMIQLQQSTGFDRERLRTLLKRIEKTASDGQAVLKELNLAAHRAGVRGRAPQVYRLEAAGAALLKLHGVPDARPCGRSDEREIMHALCVLDIRLAAQQAGLKVETERTLAYGVNNHIRPDNLVTLADGTLALFETEQQADPSLLRRISESLQNKLAFYKSVEARVYSPVVRMVVNVSPGADFSKTLKVWQRVIGRLEEAGDVPFRLLAMPLTDFRDLPDWSSDAADKRWVEVRPQETRPVRQTGVANPVRALVTAPPKALLYRTTHDNRLTIEALWLWFQEQAGVQRSNYPRPDPEFFEIIQIIYAASHDDQNSPLEDAAMPWESLYLLERYLEMQPPLRKALNQAINRGGTAMRWNTTTILHRMQVTIDTFLAYHGWRSRGPLSAVSSVSWNNDEPHDFSVTVHISKRELLMAAGDGIIPAESQKRTTERALAWVLYALFAYAQYLHLSMATFW